MSLVLAAYTHNTREFIHESRKLIRQKHYLALLSPFRIYAFLLRFFYITIQAFIIFFFKPPPPKDSGKLEKPLGRIAVIGAGLTGISSAAHAIAHGFEVVIYERTDRVGGIWAHVNKTSGLQLNSLIYRFFPGLLWTHAFPRRDEILGEIHRVWKEYKLDSRTRFETPVTSVKRAPAQSVDVDAEDLDPKKAGHARWIINDGSDGIFDAVIVTIGTCGDPARIGFPGMPGQEEEDSDSGSSSGTGGPSNGRDKKHAGDDSPDEYEGQVYGGVVLHSSELDDADLEGKNVVVVGSGASGVEAVETALGKGAKGTVMLARDDKWIIPRNIFFDTALAAQPFGREMPLSFLWEWFLRAWQYHGIEDLSPRGKGIFEGTPIVNDVFLDHVRAGKCDYVRGDTLRFTTKGVLVNVRDKDSKPGDRGEKMVFEGDVVVLATGFKRPQMDFLPGDLFPDGYDRPNLYLQNFCTEDWSVLLTNSAYINAIGTVGHFHIGIYTRVLLVLLMDKGARPLPKDMKLWVDNIRFIKSGARGGALSFFTYMELTIWVLLFHVFRPDRVKWLFFIMQGWGVYPRSSKKFI
ncbi:hypothetical protein JAAARDRAFT_202926 [Jaapia argillacea MUCL 33604]|uniref:FAD/NAD(P)-binding domain-containing protein n=1 Tax=Jaapia argillacea MUCL 33604 TaxID=933084 RepID=A0A067QLK1_9AGAM|nr:hypothetical protein JAAARDRAFT_202926 [Jaapia argillacea MUCL 33604]